MGSNLDDRLLRGWEESRHRQHLVRTVLARSSLPVDRFEDWALEMIADALSARYPEPAVKRAPPGTTIGVQADDR